MLSAFLVKIFPIGRLRVSILQNIMYEIEIVIGGFEEWSSGFKKIEIILTIFET